MNYVEKYNQKIQSGEIVTSKRVKEVYRRLVDSMKRTEELI